ncbi:hypothetical protein RRG08_057041 [Elysia crispata]|uniref:Uncharacterized protein n=1 Tax=Elysia crispata TaxID=231223 RepID=A0AAE1DAJ7_9GAST|nr:hypothetical protein RRG08_057041 [Elysia crispata]
MKISVEVLASAGIKRRKPWPKIKWLGRERESLFLLDEKRVSVLYVPSGKTKRSIPKVTSLLSETVFLTSSPGGSYLVGIQASGDVFVWHKDKDELKTICGLAHFLLDADISLADGCQIFPSKDCSRMLLVISKHYVFLWQRDSQDEGNSKNNISLGKWSSVAVPARIHLPSPDSRAVALHAVFTNLELYGDCCQLSIVWNQRNNMNVTSLLIKFAADLKAGKVSNKGEEPRVQWMNLQNPLSNIQAGCEAIHMDGAYICCYSNDGQILAVGVNQKCPAQTCMLFVSPYTDTVLVSKMNGCGIKDPIKKRGKQYWVTDMVWTYDNLFLGLMLRNGSLGLITRLGEPLVLLSKGCSLELGPAYFLPFTPAISVQSDLRSRRNQDNGTDHTSSYNSEADPLRQRFSVTSHPSLPILLVSDGYLVVIAQLPSELSQMILMRDLVLESSSHLKQIAETNRLDLTLANAYNLPASELEGVKISPRRTKNGRRGGESRHMASAQYRFEEPSVSLNETLDSEVSLVLGADESAAVAGQQHGAGLQEISSGKLVFGEPDILLVTEGSFLSEPNSTMRALQLAKANLFTVWKLAASTTELWSVNLDKIVTHGVHNMVKLFSLVLDCPQIRDLLDDPAQVANMPQAVHTASLFKVISMYKQLLDLLQLDCHQRHLLAAVLQLSHKTMSAILSSLGLRQSDPRLKTLTGCFTLLKFTEKSLMQAYVSMPSKLQEKGLIPRVAIGEGEIHYGGGESTLSGTQLAKRLTSTWTLLYKSVAQFAASSEVSAADSRQAQALQTAIQQVLLELDVDIPLSQAPPAVSNGELLSMDGRHTMAMNAWKHQLSRYKELGNVKNASRLLHSLLYTYILRNDLTAAVAFVDSLIVKASPSLEDDLDPDQMSATHDIQPSLMTFVTKTLRSQAFHEPDMVPCIHDRAIRQMVQSMARFMAAYFSNQTVFIFPPHNPMPLPAVHFETSIANSRIIPKYHEDLAASIRHQQLGQIWTVERTLEYLLLSGLLCEATWFADRVGDWKAAYQLSVAHTLHRRLAPPVYVGAKKPVSLPEWLGPDAIMKGKLEKIVLRDFQLSSTSSDLSMLTKGLEEIALAGVMGYVEIGSWLLAELVTKLKVLVGQMTPLVTKDFYLPAPPLFCPQPATSSQLRMSMEMEDETKLRHRVSSVIQLALCVMNAAHLSIPAGTWYTKALETIQQKATQFKIITEGPCLDLPDTLYSYLEMEKDEGSFDIDSEDPSVNSVQASFRDLCSLLWLLHARDKLSLCLRSREKFLTLGLDVENKEQWLRECFLTLQWAVHMIAFCRYLSDEASIYKVILSVLLDLPATEDTANILAEHMYSQDNLHPEVQDRLERILQSWQSIIIVPESDGRSVGDSLDMDEDGRKSVTFLGASPRGKSLSVYFHKQCMAVDKTLKKKKQCYGSFEEFVFADTASSQPRAAKSKHILINIGSRPFETKRSYLEFLDTFFSVSFSKVLDVMAGKDKKYAQPFLRSFARDIVDREMLFFVQRVAGSAHRKMQGLAVLAGGGRAHPNVHDSPGHGQSKRSRRRSVSGRTSGRADIGEDGGPAAGSRPVGLFRGKSMVETPLERSHACVKRYDSEPDRLDELDYPPFEAMTEQQRRPSLGSRFSHSEETLYGSQIAGGQRQYPGWSLTVNFGKKYTALQQLLEWLEVWGNKTHTLSLKSGADELLHTGSQLKLHIPAQLIVLALWLLEHKYHASSQSRRRSLSRSGRQAGKSKKASRGRRAQRLSRSPQGSQSPAGSMRSSRSGAGTPPIYPENSLLMHQSAPRYTASPNLPSQQAVGSRHSSPTTIPPGPAQASTLEEDQIIDAYTQVLDGPEDSSSIAVSSLASDELDDDLKNTFNALKGSSSPGKDNTALNHTIFPKDDSPERGAPIPQNSSTPKQANSMPVTDQRTPSVSPPRVSHQAVPDRSVSERTSRSDRRGRHQPVSQGSQVPAVGDGIASQLQGIIRDELRRIMEVQHRSVLAMMGALDEVEKVSEPVQVVQTATPSAQAVKNISSSQGGKLNRHSRSQNHNRGAAAFNSENLEDESVAEMVSFKEELLVAQHSAQSHARVPETGEAQGSGQVRGALAELHNLQSETVRSKQQQHQQQPSYAEEISSRANRLFSQQQGYPSQDGSVRLPLLAWGSKQDQPSGPIPLLHISSAQDTSSDPFRNLRRFLPQVPRPQPHSSPPSFSQPSQLSHLFPSLRLFQAPQAPPPQSQQRFPPPPYDPVGIPLLSVSSPGYSSQPVQTAPTPAASPEFFPLLRILPPGASEQEMQRSKIEETRQRLLQKFQQQVLEDKENVDQARMTQRLLHLEPQVVGEQLDSARSEKSQLSEKLPSEKALSEEVQLGEQERAASAQSTATGIGALDGTLSDGGHTGSAAADASINDGYALPKGIFESYLQLGEHLMGPEAGQTTAAFQLKMAQAMQRQVEKRIRPKVDFSTMTQEHVDLAMATDPAMEVVRTAEAATSITKDTGVDPIEEALRDYNLKRNNNVIPPDIFMGLRFADQDRQTGVTAAAPSEESGKGRSYLNVVDIRASAVLRDIPERVVKEDKNEVGGLADLSSATLASQRAALQIGALEDTLREKLAAQPNASTAVRGHDSLTVRMFDQLQAGREDRMSIAVMPRSSMSEPKTAMLRRLQDMSDQIKAIDDMSQNIEREFKSSHLLLSTLQDVNASIQRSRSPSPDRSRVSPQRHKELRYSLETTEEYDERDEDEAGSDRTLTPHLPPPKTSTKSPQASARSARSKSSLRSRSASELTELLTEVLAEQGVDLESAGYPKELAQQLEIDAREQIARQDRFAKSRITPREKLESIKRADEDQVSRRTREEREDLKKWMASKFHERQEDYRKHRQELIEREPKPFKSGLAVTKLNLQKLDEERSERRQHMAADFMNQRLSEAEHLMGSIIVDKPELPPWGELATGEASPTSYPTLRSTQTGRNTKRKSRSPARRQGPSSHKPQILSRSPSETKQSQTALPSTVKGILKPSVTSSTLAREATRLSSSDPYLANLESLSTDNLSVDSSADIINYARQILDMDRTTQIDSFEISDSTPALGRRQASQAPVREAKVSVEQQQVKSKSFADMVRLQRPAVTRKWQDVNKQRQQSSALAAERQMTLSSGQKTWTVQDPNLVNGKPKEYGSKRIPGSSPRQPVDTATGSARRVKTYAERLQEMKPASKVYSPPASRRRPASSRTMSTLTTRSTSQRGPAHKPQTYVEQLKSLSSRAGPTHRGRSYTGQGKIPVRMRTFLRSHGPVHEPKTYTEQLRELNPHPHIDTVSMKARGHMHPSVPASSAGAGSRASSRPRPYGDPYSEMDYEELASVLSDWDMDENVRNIIYGGSTAPSSVVFKDDIDLSMSGGDIRRPLAPSEGQSDYFDVVMQGDGLMHRSVEEGDLDLGVGDYRSSVDIHEIERIADAASVGSGSVLSVIDWDAVNDLIKDV